MNSGTLVKAPLLFPRFPTGLGAAGFCLVLALAVAGSNAAEEAGKDRMQLTSTVFAEGAAIPAKHTCDAKNVSPPLKWSGVPAGAKSLALIVDDPDAPVGTWVHWVLYDLPATGSELHLGYGGPCPPPGKPHRYFFKLYALDAVLDLKPGLTKKDLEKAMEGHILERAQLMGTYQRK